MEGNEHSADNKDLQSVGPEDPCQDRSPRQHRPLNSHSQYLAEGLYDRCVITPQTWRPSGRLGKDNARRSDPLHCGLGTERLYAINPPRLSSSLSFNWTLYGSR